MIPKLNPDQSYLAIDYGAAKVGLARAGAVARLPEPLPAVRMDKNLLVLIQQLVKEQNIGLVIIGLPRNLRGDETPQTHEVRTFADQIKNHISVPVVFADESLSSKRADAYLNAHKKAAVDQDSIAACFILQEFFTTMEGQL